MQNVSVLGIGNNKGQLRVWLQGNMLAKAGFLPQECYAVKEENGAVILYKTPAGNRIVSRKKKSDESYVPVIDLNSNSLLAMFDGMEHVRVTFNSGEIKIEYLATEAKARERMERTKARIENGEAIQVGSLSHGGGIASHAVHAGLEAEGIKSELAFACEIEAEFIEQAMTANDAWSRKTIALNMPMQELAVDHATLSALPQLDILEAGLPCTAASVAGRAKTKMNFPEAHPDVGHLCFAFLAIVARLNPTAAILENVVPYLSTASMAIITSQLRDMKYEVHTVILDGADWNALEHRKRMIMVAVTKGMEFDFANLIKPAKVERKLGEVLEAIPLDSPAWNEMAGLKAKELRDAEKGSSFAMQIFDADSPKICTLTKDMTKNRSTDAKIRHPLNPDLLRIPTKTEHARCKGFPEHLIAGCSETLGHQIAGQSVIYEKLKAVGRLTGSSLKSIGRKAAQLTRQPDYSDLPLFALAA